MLMQFARQTKKTTNPRNGAVSSIAVVIFLLAASFKRKTTGAIACMVIGAASFGFASTCYIDADNGNDAANGTSESSAWRTFSNVKTLLLGPGDAVLLKRGCTWNQQLFVQGSGTAGNFLVVGDYGSGPRPKIRMSGSSNLSDKCIIVKNASYAKIHNLELCQAYAGLVLYYDYVYNNHSVYIDSIYAHDMEGPSYNPNDADRVACAEGICITGREDTPNDQTTVMTDLRITNCEIADCRFGLALDWCNHAAVDGTMIHANKFHDVLIENCYIYGKIGRAHV
jgi:hypothetical protein